MLCAACGMLAPQPAIDPVPPALEVQSPNHWTTREVPRLDFEQILIRCLLTSGGKGEAAFEDKQVSNSLAVNKGVSSFPYASLGTWEGRHQSHIFAFICMCILTSWPGGSESREISQALHWPYPFQKPSVLPLRPTCQNRQQNDLAMLLVNLRESWISVAPSKGRSDAEKKTQATPLPGD